MQQETVVSTNMGAKTYADTVARGFYGKNLGGLFGKYDNVRAHWEDAMTRVALRPFVRERVEQCVKGGRGVRILDLGCGAGQGYEQLIRIDQHDLDLAGEHRYVLQPEQIELYLGVDLSEAMIDKGRENYRGLESVQFDVADLRDRLGAARAKAPFDIYFSSYGALSHLDTKGLRDLIEDISRHAKPGAVVVLDLLGRYSPEWPAYWGAKTEDDKVRPYSMSYLYPPDERKSGSVEKFPLRFWTGDEVRGLAAEITETSGVEVGVRELLDRSIFVGRHVDTNEYGTLLSPMRAHVNQLYEQNLRTNLELLRVVYRDVPGADDLNRFFHGVATCWNVLVDFTIERLRGTRINLVEMDGWSDFRPELQMALMTMDRIIDGVAWIDVGDVRANVIEPQLAYVLRRMLHRLQEGRGCGHGLLAVLQIGKPLASKGRPALA
jgi:SAM-dependent methyltransferase